MRALFTMKANRKLGELRPPSKRSSFQVQHVVEIVGSWAAANFLLQKTEKREYTHPAASPETYFVSRVA